MWNTLEDDKHFEKGQFFESFFEIQQETQLTGGGCFVWGFLGGSGGYCLFGWVGFFKFLTTETLEVLHNVSRNPVLFHILSQKVKKKEKAHMDTFF